eukprot:GHVU01113096.1.p8 GENE.GHVU01113096.1~~GHVU01113096.1.p8  ORF type:complete len:108 (-),score=10.43 GHVU01113096.1:2676-2999(-)
MHAHADPALNPPCCGAGTHTRTHIHAHIHTHTHAHPHTHTHTHTHTRTGVGGSVELQEALFARRGQPPFALQRRTRQHASEATPEAEKIPVRGGKAPAPAPRVDADR